MRVGLVTCETLPEPDYDQDLLNAALRSAGCEPVMVPWDAPSRPPRDCDLFILRSCWNYYEDPEAFRGWIRDAAAGTTILNPPEVLFWNLHKRYLRDLEARRVPIVPTIWAEQDSPVDLSAIFAQEGWDEVVLKPAISAASYRTQRFSRSDAVYGQRFLDGLIADGDAMIQPYMHSVATSGERALVWIDGVFTHAVRKSPRFGTDDEQVSEALDLTPAELAFGEAVMACVEARCLYARIDVMRDADDRLCLSELELLEPSLFFLQKPEALSCFVAAVCAFGRKA